jgi:transcription elongation factor GreB
MSKAFASGDGDSEQLEPIQASVLPAGARNYITPSGVKKLEAEREQLLAQKAALGPDTVETTPRRKALERRLEIVTEHLNRAQVIDPAQQPRDKILFGAEVTVKDITGKRWAWRIVGIDETDADKGWISWMSPLARALLEKRVGEVATYADQRWTILNIRY